MDEFYGGYNYTSNCDGTTVSSAANVQDVDEDDVIIVDGLTKRFRLPGWRVAWIVGPKEFIKAIGSCGSYLDGIRCPPSILQSAIVANARRGYQCTLSGGGSLDARTGQSPPRDESTTAPLS